jgi:hypothetical protein
MVNVLPFKRCRNWRAVGIGGQLRILLSNLQVVLLGNQRRVLRQGLGVPSPFTQPTQSAASFSKPEKMLKRQRGMDNLGLIPSLFRQLFSFP